MFLHYAMLCKGHLETLVCVVTLSTVIAAVSLSGFTAAGVNERQRMPCSFSLYSGFTSS